MSHCKSGTLAILHKNKPVIQPFLHAPRCKNRIFRLHTERFEKPQTGAKYYYTRRKLWTGLLSEGTFLLTWRDHMDLSIINHEVDNINVEYK